MGPADLEFGRRSCFRLNAAKHQAWPDVKDEPGIRAIHVFLPGLGLLTRRGAMDLANWLDRPELTDPLAGVGPGVLLSSRRKHDKVDERRKRCRKNDSQAPTA